MLASLMRVLAALVITGVLALAASAIPAGAQEKSKAGPQFTLPKSTEKCVHDPNFAKTGKCVRDTPFMRRNHMKLLLHKRDQTMHNGIRTKSASLKECINCHVTKDEAGNPIKVSNPKHFCAACHRYAAVKLDCFECHRSTPDKSAKTADIPKIPAHAGLLAKNSSEARDLGKFLEGITR